MDPVSATVRPRKSVPPKTAAPLWYYLYLREQPFALNSANSVNALMVAVFRNSLPVLAAFFLGNTVDTFDTNGHTSLSI